MPPKARVLVIDDNPDAVEIMRIALADNDYDVVACLSGDEGLKRVQAEQPDCIVLDVMMPEMNGFNVCQSLHEMGITTPVVILSAKSDLKAVARAKELGVFEYLTKPVSDQRLAKTVAAAIAAAAREADDDAGT